MKFIVFVLCLVCVSFGLSKVTVPYRAVPNAAASSAGVNGNSDTIYNAYNRLCDTINGKIPRFTGQLPRDSTFQYIRVDSMVNGKLHSTFIDTITTHRITPDSVIGPVRGNVTGNVTGNCSGTAATVTGAAQSAITSVGTLTGLTSSGTVSVDSLYSTKGIKGTNFTGNVIGNVTGNVTGNASGTAATVTGAAQSAITSVGTLTSLTSSGTVSADSVYSTKGVKGTNFTGNVIGNVTGNVTGSSGSCTGNAATATTATNQSGGTVSATTGTFSSNVSVDSLYSTKGINANQSALSAGNSIIGYQCYVRPDVLSYWSSVGGGLADSVNTMYSFIGNGEENVITSSTPGSNLNRHGFIGGGVRNLLFSRSPSCFGFLGGGYQNKIDSNATYPFLGAGYQNAMHSNGGGNVIVGGSSNTISGNGSYGSILGGLSNTLTGEYNVHCGGRLNATSGQSSSLLGGEHNSASGTWSAELGGLEDSAIGAASIVAGVGCVGRSDYTLAIGSQQRVSGTKTMAFGYTSATAITDTNAFIVNTQRFVLPRVTSAQRTALASLLGQMVFDTDSAKVFVNYTGTTWKALW